MVISCFIFIHDGKILYIVLLNLFILVLLQVINLNAMINVCVILNALESFIDYCGLCDMIEIYEVNLNYNKKGYYI